MVFDLLAKDGVLIVNSFNQLSFMAFLAAVERTDSSRNPKYQIIGKTVTAVTTAD